MVKQILMMGDDEKVMYHPGKPVWKVLSKALASLGEWTYAEGVSAFEMDLKAYDLLVIYSDRWETTIQLSDAKKIQDYVTTGGQLLVLHSGISLADEETIRDMVGGQFTGHPERQELTFTFLQGKEMPITSEPFTLFEEPYRYAFNASDNPLRHVFMVYDDGVDQYDSGWYTLIGMGKVVYLHPGHEAAIFQDSAYQNVVKQVMKFLLKL